MAQSILSPVGSIGSLAHKVAIITGASSGIGRAIAQAFAAAGAYVVSADITPDPPKAPIIQSVLVDSDLTTPTVEYINKYWPSNRSGLERSTYVHCDVTDEKSVKATIAAAVGKYGRLDIQVNNAGIAAETNARTSVSAGRPARIHETPVSILDMTLQHQRATDELHRGWIINLGSVVGSVGIPGISSYCTSKGAIMLMTKSVALEYAKEGIHVNAIQPGFTDTSMIENLYRNAPEGKPQWTKTTSHPWGRTGRPEDIARVAVFLAGEGASYMTGAGVPVDGGYLAQ